MQCSEATIATESACYRKYYYLRLDYTEIIDFASSSPAHSLVTLDAHTTLLGIYPRVAAEMAVGHINERGVLPLLSRVNEHPYFFHTIPPLSSYGKTINFMQ